VSASDSDAPVPAPADPEPSPAFGRLVRAETTKLLSVRRWLIGLAAAVALTVGFGVLSAAGSGTDANEHPAFVVGPAGTAVVDDLYFVHRTTSGDATVTARVATQEPSHPRAQAGLMLKDGTTSGSRYASIAVTPAHGVRFDSDFATDADSTSGSAPRWLRLTRAGTEVTGYVSDDGDDWRPVGTADLTGLPDEVEVGLFVASPPKQVIRRTAGATSVNETFTVGTATFEDLSMAPVTGPADRWHGDEISGGFPKKPGDPLGGVTRTVGSVTETDGAYTVTGSGQIGPAESPDDSVQASLFGTVFGLMALVAVSVLFVTSEYKHDLIRTTFTASPRRWPVLAAKATVVAATTFGLGLVASIAAYFAARPILRSGGFTLPAYAPTSLGQPNVLRAIVGNALLLTVFALLGLALGAILRRGAGAIATIFTLGILPLFVATAVPTASRWLLWLTPAGGFAVQRAKPPSNELAEPWSQTNPWVGLGIACAYAAAAMATAVWLVERRDA